MFETHKLNEQGFENVKEFKEIMAKSVKEVEKLLPEGREKSLFLTKMEEAMFFGTKSIASKDGNYEEIITY